MSTLIEPCTTPTEPGVYVAKRSFAGASKWMMVYVHEGRILRPLYVTVVSGMGRSYEMSDWEFRERIVIE